MARRSKATGKRQREPASQTPTALAVDRVWPEPWALAAVLLVYLAGAVGYWVGLPYGQGPDEESHGLFIQSLVGQAPAGTEFAWGLPVFETSGDGPNFETHQPPLYYLLAALLYRLGGIGLVPLLSLVAGAGLVWVTWRLTRELAGRDLALAAAAVVAVWPMLGFLASRVNNDPLANLIWAVVLWRLVLWQRDGGRPRDGLSLGLLVGAGLLTKQNSLLLLPLLVLAAGLAGWRSGRWREALAQLLLALLVAGLTAGWWFLRNRALYGDLFAQAAFDQRFLPTRMTPSQMTEQFAQLGKELRYWPYVFFFTVRSQVIYIGHGVETLPGEIFQPHLGVFLAAAVGAVYTVVRRWRRAGCDPVVATTLLLVAAAVLVTALFVKFNQTYFQAQGRYLFVVTPFWALLLAGGLSRPFPPGSPLRRYGLWVAVGWLGLLNLGLLTCFVPGLLDGG